MSKLLNEENIWNNDVRCDIVQGPMCRISRAEVMYALKKMKEGKAAGPCAVVAEMLKAAGDTGIEWLTSHANEVVQLSKIPDD